MTGVASITKRTGTVSIMSSFSRNVVSFLAVE